MNTFMKLFACLLLFAISPAPASAAETLTSDTGDQKSVEITVYNVNLGLVKDKRVIDLKTGDSELRFMGVASSIIPQSVSIKSLVDADSLGVLEQNYEFDLLSPQKLLDKYVGKKVKLFTKNYYTGAEELVDAEVLSNNNGTVYRIGDQITFNHPGRLIFPEVPENLISKPTLVWLISNDLKKPQEIEVSYLTNNITWRADYVLTVSKDDKSGDMTGWVTITNQSGAAYKDATLKLVAGDVQRAREEYDGLYKFEERSRAGRVAEAPSFKEESFFEYHLYTLSRKATVKENQTKQINLLTANGFKIKKDYLFYGADYYYRSQYGEVTSNQKIAVFMEFKNSKQNQLGMPLPKGIIRLYKKDASESLQFIGENNIDHTPKDEDVRIKVGDAFDVVGSRKQTNWKKISTNVYEASFDVVIKNHKDEDIMVRVLEPIPGDWRILESTHVPQKPDAHTAEFHLDVPKNGQAKLTYTVRMKF